MDNGRIQETEMDLRFRNSLKRLGLKFNQQNVCLLSVGYIPLYVIFIVSLGKSFGFAMQANEINLEEFQLSFSKIKDQIGGYGTCESFKRGINKIVSRINTGRSRIDRFQKSRIQLFIRNQFTKTTEFLKGRKDIFISPADKGGKAIIMHRDVYYSKMNKYMEENTKARNYFECKGMDLDYVRYYIEEKYTQLRNSFNGFLLRDSNNEQKGYNCTLNDLTYEAYVIPRIYGLVKIHKEDLNIRPIISSTNHMGKSLMKWLLYRLNIIADHLGRFDVKNADEVFKKLNGRQIKRNHVFVSWDFDSMYTNIPIGKAKEIIRKYYHLIEPTTTVPLEVFLDGISFFTEHSAYFLYQSTIFRQCKGLAMGNSLSQVLACIVTSEAIIEAMKNFTEEDVFFFGKYVDDLLAVVDSDMVDALEESIIRNIGTMTMKITRENENNELTYLNIILQRREEQICIKWCQKECSSQRILDFYSSHSIRTKINVCEEYILSALRVSTCIFWNETVEKLERIFENSNYPKRFIRNRFWNAKRRLNIISDETRKQRDWIVSSEIGITDLDPLLILKNELRADTAIGKTGKTDKMYISFPACNDIARRTNSLIKKLNFSKRVILSGRNMKSVRRSVFTNLKSKRGIDSIINATAMVSCEDCSFQCKVRAIRLDLKRSVQHMKRSQDSVIGKHLNDFPGHTMSESLSGIRQFGSRFDCMLE